MKHVYIQEGAHLRRGGTNDQSFFPSLDVIQYLMPECFAFVLEKRAWLQYCRCFLPLWLGLQRDILYVQRQRKPGSTSTDRQARCTASNKRPSQLNPIHCNHPISPLSTNQPTNAPTPLASFGRMFCLPECLKGRPTGFSIASSS